MAGSIEVVHIGSASRDIDPADPRGWRLGGGVAYAALTTARLGLATAALVGVDDVTADASELDLLRAAGVELRLARLVEAPVFENRETATGRIQVCHAVGRPLTVPADLGIWRGTRGWSVVPVAGEVPEAWAQVVPGDAYLAVGWQGSLRDLRVGELVGRRAPTPTALLRRADLVGVSRNDLDPAMDPADIEPFLKQGADLVVTDGDRGGHVIRIRGAGPGSSRPYASIAARQVDPTGAGDTFLAALLVSVLRADDGSSIGERFAPDVGFAAAAASLTVEGVGLPAVPDLAAVERRAARPT